MRSGADDGGDARSTRDILRQVQSTTSARRVYGKPVEHDGVVVIPAASLIGGGGGGSGDTGATHAEDLDITDAPGADVGSAPPDTGSGAGFGLIARPVGAYVIRDGEVHWRPAFDVNRFVFWGNMVAIAYFFVLWRIERARTRKH